MKTKRIIKDQKGGALVEFAIVLPLLVVLVMGIIEFGLLCYNKQVIANASREGARAGIVNGGPDYSGNQAVKDIVKTYCNPRMIDFSGNTVEDDDITLTPSTRSTNFGDDFSVQVEYNYSFLIPSLFGLGSTKTISAETVMSMEAIPA